MKKETPWTIILVLITLLWGSIHPASKYLLNNGVDANMMAFLRFFFATVPLIPFFVLDIRKQEKPKAKDIWMLMLLGFLGVGSFSFLMFLGLSRTNASSSAILINTQPLFTAFLAAFIIKEQLTVRQIIGVFIGLLGISFVATRGHFSTLSLKSGFLLGNILCIFAALCISLFYIWLKQYIVKFGSIIPTFITNASGSLMLFIAAVVTGTRFSPLLHLAWKEWFFILYIGVIATALTYVMFNRVIPLMGLVRATAFKFLTPVFGVIISIIFLGEQLNIFVIFGIVIVLAAIATVQFPGKTG